MSLLPESVISHWLHGVSELRLIGLPDSPVKFRAVAKVGLLAALKRIGLPAAVDVKVPKVVFELPLISLVPLPPIITVPLLWVKVPLLVRLPEIVSVPDGATKVPAETVTLPVAVMSPPAVKVLLPLFMIK